MTTFLAAALIVALLILRENQGSPSGSNATATPTPKYQRYDDGIPDHPTVFDHVETPTQLAGYRRAGVCGLSRRSMRPGKYASGDGAHHPIIAGGL